MVTGNIDANFTRNGTRYTFSSVGPDSGSISPVTDGQYAPHVPSGMGMSVTLFPDEMPSGPVEVIGPDGTVVDTWPRYRGTMYRKGVTAPSQPGQYTVRVGGERWQSFEVGTYSSQAEEMVDPAYGDPVSETNTTDPSDYVEEPEPEDFAGIVNADNEDGAALAPALRRRGIEVDDVGTTAEFDGTELEIVDEGVVSVVGQTIEVGDITDSDEVARVVDGPNAGAPIPTDSDVAPDGGSGGGVIGAVGVGIVLLLAGAAALLGGGD